MRWKDENFKKVSVLGTEYRIIEDNCNNDPLLQNSFGYTDYTSKKIVITDFPKKKKLKLKMWLNIENR